MLYATEGVDKQEDFDKAMVGVASVWCVSVARLLKTEADIFLGTKETREHFDPTLCYVLMPTRCNRHLLGLGQHIKKSLAQAGLIGYQFGTVGVSDGISMGTFGSEF
jgi:dihydroxy-acid dehydratase